MSPEIDHPPAFLSPDDAAELLGLTPGGVRAAIRRGELAAVKVGRCWRVPFRTLEQLAARAEDEAQDRRRTQPPGMRLADAEGAEGWTAGQLRALAPTRKAARP
jgi:excisionase family DNA binding protein